MTTMTTRTSPPTDGLDRWLVMLGTLTATTGTVAEAHAKLRAYAPLLRTEFPPEAFTRDSLTAVAKACKFFPTYGELYDALGRWWRDNRPPLPRLAAPQEPQRSPPTQADKDAVHARVLEVEAALRSKFQPPEDRRPQPRYLSAEYLDQVNPLPNGKKRTQETTHG